MRTADADVERYLKLFTFMPLPQIQSIVDQHMTDPSKRIAQHALAYEFLELVHGQKVAKDTKEEHEAFFQKRMTVSSLLADTESQKEQSTSPEPQTSTKPDAPPANPLLDNQNAQTRERGTYVSPSLNPFAPQASANSNPSARIVLPKSLIYEQPVARVLYAAGLVSSRSEGHRLAAAKGAYVGHQSGVSAAHGQTQMTDQLTFTPAKLHDTSMMWKYVIRDEQFDSDGKVGGMVKEGEAGILILRTGKWKIRVCRIVSDELFESMGLPDPPGWAEIKAERSRDKNVEELKEMVETQSKGRKETNAAVQEQQRQGMRFFRKEGVSEEKIQEAIWQTWEKAKNAGKNSRAR